MKVLVTGSQGMLGTDVVDSLRSSFEVFGTGRSEKRASPVPFYSADLAERDAVWKLFNQVKPDVVIHAAAMTQVDLCEDQQQQAFRDNVEASRWIAEAASKHSSLLIYISTDYVFDGKKKGPYREEDRACPLNVYGKTKWLAEEEIRRLASSYLIFRTSWVFGINGKSFPRTILEKAVQVSRLQIVSDQIGRPSYTVDLADALNKLISRGFSFLNTVHNETYHLTNDHLCSWADFGRAALELAGMKEVEVEDVPTEFYKRPATRPKNSVLSLDKSKSVLGLSLRSWEDALKDFVVQWRTEQKTIS